MWKNVCNQISYSSFLEEKNHKEWISSLDWLLVSEGIVKFPIGPFENHMSISKDTIPSDRPFDKYKAEAEEGISQIQDPLWRRVCLDALQILGPVAFNDLWKSKLITVSPKGKIAYLTCPNQSIVEKIEQYHFVIIAALKKFYPYLSSLEIELREDILFAFQVSGALTFGSRPLSRR